MISQCLLYSVQYQSPGLRLSIQWGDPEKPHSLDGVEMGTYPLSLAWSGSLGREAILHKPEKKVEEKGGKKKKRWRKERGNAGEEHHCCGFTGWGQGWWGDGKVCTGEEGDHRRPGLGHRQEKLSDKAEFTRGADSQGCGNTTEGRNRHGKKESSWENEGEEWSETQMKAQHSEKHCEQNEEK